MNTTPEMPRYQSHKQVRAVRIVVLEIHEDKSATIAGLFDERHAVFDTAPGWAERFAGSDEDTGYYVEYEDGFASWSPTDVFERGYTRIDEGDTPC